MHTSMQSDLSLGDSEQDANAALTELDRGLRSSKAGEQCEAIVKFSRLFEKYPFPILINSALLKLSDVFRLGTNFLRLCILDVCQQAERHLDKILNVDEFVRRIYSVIHSNDPVARALTLRTLGSIAVIIPERKQVHHSIRNALDSHDEVELKAAIYAAGKFASHSKTFAVNICGKIANMISSVTYPVEIKFGLLPVFQHMYHDAQTATHVHDLLIKLLPSYPSQAFVILTLKTLTKLAASSLVEIPQQVTLLLQYLLNDCRFSVKNATLKDLHYLSSSTPHLWSKSNIEDIVDFTEATQYVELKCLGLQVLTKIVSKSAGNNLTSIKDENIQNFITRMCLHSDLSVSTKAVQLLTEVTVQNLDHDQIELESSDCLLHIESLLYKLVMTSSDADKSKMIYLKSCLLCCVKLCKAYTEICQHVVNSIGGLLDSVEGAEALLLYETLGAISERKWGSASLLVGDLINTLNNNLGRTADSIQTNGMVQVCTLLFLAITNKNKANSAIQSILATSKSLNMWASYRIGRAALRYGHDHVASAIFQSLMRVVSSEHLYFWISGLYLFSEAEACLTEQMIGQNLVDRIESAINYYMKGMSALKAASTPAFSLTFQCEYVRLRAEMLQALVQLIHSCRSLRTAPPPAIANSMALANKDEIQRCGRMVQQLRKCAKEFNNIGEGYKRLYQCAFDADPKSLLIVSILQQTSVFLSQAVEAIAFKSSQSHFVESKPFSFIAGGEQEGVEFYQLKKCCQVAWLEICQLLMSSDCKSISHKHVDCLISICEAVATSPFCFPRYFFQMLQNTSVQLAITPVPRVNGEPITVSHQTNLAIKVDGVIQHGKSEGIYRSVKSVKLNVSSQPQLKSSHLADSKINELSNNLENTVEPHNDFFSVQFLLAFPNPGLHMVTIDTTLIDQYDVSWNIGLRTQMTVKSFDDSSKGTSISSRPSVSSPRY